MSESYYETKKLEFLPKPARCAPQPNKHHKAGSARICRFYQGPSSLAKNHWIFALDLSAVPKISGDWMRSHEIWNEISWDFNWTLTRSGWYLIRLVLRSNEFWNETSRDFDWDLASIWWGLVSFGLRSHKIWTRSWGVWGRSLKTWIRAWRLDEISWDMAWDLARFGWGLMRCTWDLMRFFTEIPWKLDEIS